MCRYTDACGAPARLLLQRNAGGGFSVAARPKTATCDICLMPWPADTLVPPLDELGLILDLAIDGHPVCDYDRSSESEASETPARRMPQNRRLTAIGVPDQRVRMVGRLGPVKSPVYLSILSCLVPDSPA